MRSEHASVVSFLSRDTVVRELLRPFAIFLADAQATEVVINRPGQVLVETGRGWVAFDAPQITLERCLALANAVATFTEQEVGPRKPILSAMLPDGERIQIVVPPAVESDAVSISIRKPAASIRSYEDYERDGTFSRYVWARPAQLQDRRNDLEAVDLELVRQLESGDLAGFLTSAVLAKKNIAVVGDTGSGKTTLMKTVCQSIPLSERLITIEDVRELFLPRHANCVHLLYSKGGQGVAHITPSDLIASSMRMKPDRVLLAELRGAEAFDFLKLLTTGHSGSITSFHAESCALASERYVFMCKEHEQAAIYDAPALKRLVALTIDIIVHVVARTAYERGAATRKDRFVAEVHFDPIAKLQARFGDASLHHAES